MTQPPPRPNLDAISEDLRAAEHSLALIGDGDWTPQDDHTQHLTVIGDALVAYARSLETALEPVHVGPIVMAEIQRLIARGERPAAIQTATEFSNACNASLAALPPGRDGT